jgi:hypothetical protein
VPKLVREVAKTKPVPKTFSIRHDGLLLGMNSHAGQRAEVRLTEEERGQHMHIMGVSGSGKSTLLLNMIRQDIENGEGVAVLDPHGDLIDRILEIVPTHRIADVVLINPSDEAYSVGFNILSAHSDLEKTLLASDLVSVFQRLSTSWGDQMGSVLQNAIMAFLESSEGGTISGLRRFLIEPAFRSQFLNTVRDPAICRLERSDFDFNLAVSSPRLVEPGTAREARQQVIAASRKTFGTPRAEIEAEIMRSLGTEEKEQTKEPKALRSPKLEVSEKPTERTFDNPPKAAPIVSEPTKPPSTPISTSEVPKPEIVIPASKPKEGRGGEQHTTIQMRIKAAALALGFGAETENETPDGKGSADLVIQNVHRSIACEIAVTTTIDHEFGNVTKCLKAGFHEIAVISSSPARLKQIEEAVKGGLSQDESALVGYYSPDAFISHIEKLAAADASKPLPGAGPSEKVIRGRVVRRHTPKLTEGERKQQEKVQIAVVAEILRTKKKK